MNNYCQYLYTVVSSDCSRLAGCRVGLSKHHPDMSLLRFRFLALTKPASLDSTLPFPCHCHHWAWVHVGHLGVHVVALCKLGVVPLLTHKSWEEWSGWQIRIVLPEMSLTGSHHPEQRLSGLILRMQPTWWQPAWSLSAQTSSQSHQQVPAETIKVNRCFQLGYCAPGLHQAWSWWKFSQLEPLPQPLAGMVLQPPMFTWI